ncbi:MAG TPA: S8 family peptidase [Solirubrobacterales bacterium]|nr:S8 family peptidase [Solirubrobacterales bacterium]
MTFAGNIVFRMRWMAGLALGVLAIALPVAFAGSGAQVPSAGSTPALAPITPSLTPALADMAERTPGKRVEVIVQLTAGAKRADAAPLVRELGGTVTRDLHIINAVVAKLPAAGASELAASAKVKAVSLNGAVKPQWGDGDSLATSFNQSIQSDGVWTSKSSQATGKGVGVAVVDTGIAGDVPDFRRSSSDRTSRVIGSAVVHPDAVTAGDSYGHGTHVAGIIAGDSYNRGWGDPNRGRYSGVAPDANLISIKASDELGNSTILDVIYGIQFAVDHKDEYNIRVLNLSLESTVAQSYKTDPLDAAVEAAWFKGIVVVAAAGNRGSAADAVSYAPGNDPYAISVGAVDDQGTKGPGDDLLATWSSRGTTQDGVSKPDVFAPGAKIVSNLAPGSAFTALCPTCVVNGEYIRAGGTSMAAPMVSGTAALLLELNPSLTPNQIKGLLKKWGRPLSEGVNEVSARVAANNINTAGQSVANGGLTPNSFIDPATGEIDYSRSSWSRSSWSDAGELLRSSWSRSSWSRSSWSSQNSETDAVDPSRSSWSRSSWSTSWSK